MAEVMTLPRSASGLKTVAKEQIEQNAKLARRAKTAAKRANELRKQVEQSRIAAPVGGALGGAAASAIMTFSPTSRMVSTLLIAGASLASGYAARGAKSDTLAHAGAGMAGVLGYGLVDGLFSGVGSMMNGGMNGGGE